MPRRPELDDLLADSIVVLETLKEASSAVSAVPFLGAVIGTCVNLLKTIENVKSLDDRGKRLARRAADLAQYIEQRISHDVEAIDADLGQNLATLTITLERVQQDIEEQRKRKFRNRLLRYNSISRKLDEHMDALDRARDSFNAWCLLSLERKMNRQLQHAHMQATTDKDGYHLFRKPELRLRAVKGDWIIQNEKAGEEWTADWGGRTVVVRRLQSSRAQQEDLAVLCRRIPQLFHPHVAQILGYSHSDVPEKFYVMETGTIQFDEDYIWTAMDTKTLLHTWLQTMLDFKTAFDYASSQLTLTDARNSDPFPNTTLGPDGKLLLHVEDLVNSHNLSMFYFWEMSNKRSRKMWNSYVPPFHTKSYYGALHECLYQLKEGGYSNRHAADLKSWSRSKESEYFYDIPASYVGDYGYYMPLPSGAQEFIRLGNVSAFLPAGQNFAPGIWESHPHVNICPFIEGQQEVPQYLKCRLDPFRTHARYMYTVHKTLRQECLDTYWDRIFDIAKEHGVAAHELVLVREITDTALATVLGSCGPENPCENEEIVHSSTTQWLALEERCLEGQMDVTDPVPLDVYFHFHADQKNVIRLDRMSWGYWSLDPEPSPGPWPEISLPGIVLFAGHLGDARCEQLTFLEVELFQFFQHQQSQGRGHSRNLSGDARFEEIGEACIRST